MTHKLDDMIELPESQPNGTYKKDLECEMVMVKMPRCMLFLGSTDSCGEHIGSLDMMNNKMENPIPQRTPQVLPSFKKYTLPWLTQKNASEVSSFDEPKPKPQPSPSFSSFDISQVDKSGPKPHIKPHSLDSFKMKVIDRLTIHTPPSTHMASFYPKDVYCYYHPFSNTLSIKKQKLVAETFDWDKEEVSNVEEITQVKVLMALADDELDVGKNHARNHEWIDITMRKAPSDLESSKESESKSLTPLPPLKKSLGASLSSKVMPLTYRDHSPRERPSLGTMKYTKPETQKYSRHNRVILVRGGVLAESSQSNDSSIGISCTTCGSNVHSTTDHNDFEHFKRGEKIQATKAREPTNRKKSQTAEMIMSFIKMVENQNDVKVKQIRIDNRPEFRNFKLESFCDEKGIYLNLFSPYTP
nr:retrovirus-related Pol polyprotein from transposon TNT 1-94 [Tanacetum cinerariifolium]